jgi:hypothetical protein
MPRLHGTSVIPRPETHRPPRRHPRWRTRGRSPPRTAVGAHVAPPADGPANASPDDPHDPPPDVCLLPSQPLTIEALRRPVESALHALVRVDDGAGRWVRVWMAIPRASMTSSVRKWSAWRRSTSRPPTGEGIQDDRAGELALASGVLGDVGDPQLVRSARAKLRSTRSGGASQAGAAHQQGDGVVADHNPRPCRSSAWTPRAP